jgi:hypothetical protein
MNTKQENSTSMFAATDKILNDNAAIYAALVPFNSCLTRFRAQRANINIYVATQAAKTKGVTADKAQAKADAIATGVSISSIIQAYATDNHNNTLFVNMNYPKSTLQRLADNILVNALQLIHDIATNNLAALTPYGIITLKLTAFQTLIGTFNTFIPQPRTTTNTKKTATADLAAAIKQGSKELKTLDKLMENFKTSNPDFYKTYHNARQIVDLGSHTTKLTGTITDAATGAFIPNANIVDNPDNLRAQSDEKGKYKIEKVKAGTISVHADAPNYQPYDNPAVHIKPGKSNKLNITLTHD